MSITDHLLTDEQITRFITKGYVVLQNELPQALHQEVMDKIYHVMHEEGNPGNNILPRIPEIDQFFDTPTVKGALTSVLGPDYYMHPHRHCHYNQPGNQAPGGGEWHKDGYWSSMRSHRPWWAMIFYYTQDITEDLGPTAVMPSTQYYEDYIGDKGETLLPTGKAGTMVLVHFDIWHKASLNITNLDRYMLKFQFARLKAPESPSWNHQNETMDVPEDTPHTHLNLWQDVWNWMRNEPSTSGALTNSGSSDVAQLQAELSSPDADVREKAADQLGLIGEAAASAASELGRLVNNPVEAVALNAAYALGHIGTAGTEVLLECIQQETYKVAQRAAYGLQGAGSLAVPGLVDILQHHEDEEKRAFAAFVLGMIGSAASEAIPALITSVQDESEWVCRNSIESLGMIPGPTNQAVTALVQVLETSLIGELENVAPQKGSYFQNQNFILNKKGYTAALSLLRVGKEGDATLIVNSLKKGLTSKDRYLQAYSVEALSHLRTPDAIDALVHLSRTARWCPATHKGSTF